MSERNITIQHMIAAWNKAAAEGGNTEELMGAALDVAVAKCRQETLAILDYLEARAKTLGGK